MAFTFELRFAWRALLRGFIDWYPGFVILPMCHAGSRSATFSLPFPPLGESRSTSNIIKRGDNDHRTSPLSIPIPYAVALRRVDGNG
jgi:hypothetical protein